MTDQRVEYTSYLCILARNLDVVELAVLELSEIMTEHLQALYARACVEDLLVAIPPGLKASNVLVKCGRLLLVKEVGLKVGL